MSVIVSFGRSLFPLETDVATPFSTRHPLSSHTHTLSLSAPPPYYPPSPPHHTLSGWLEDSVVYRHTGTQRAYMLIYIYISNCSSEVLGKELHYNRSFSRDQNLCSSMCARAVCMFGVCVWVEVCCFCSNIYSIYHLLAIIVNRRRRRRRKNTSHRDRETQIDIYGGGTPWWRKKTLTDTANRARVLFNMYI